MRKKRILLVRTFKPVGTGGPVPPLGPLYIASVLREAFKGIEIGFVDMGNEGLSAAEIADRIADFGPDIVGLSVLTCEADVMAETAAASKRVRPGATIIVGGPHSNTAQEAILEDRNIDFVVVREGEKTVVELLHTLEKRGDPSTVRGIAFRDKGGTPVLTEAREPIANLDSIPFPAWDLIDIPSYSVHKNWNGTLMREFYAPLSSSRGCPYGCTFCHNIFGKKVRFRSPESVFAELVHLNTKLGCREFHFVDDIFNVDAERAGKICRMIIDSGMDVSLSFPNGLRADIMTDRLLDLLREAGTYKINYGFETAVPRLQKLLKKDMDISRAGEVFARTSDLGIIAGAYFMLGIPTETLDEMRATIRFAEDSRLDVAAFFKSTAYPGTPMHESLSGSMSGPAARFRDLHFYSAGRSHAAVSEAELNRMMLTAQRRFYLKPGRILRGLRKAPRKAAYLANLMNAALLLLQGYLMQELKRP